MSWTKSAWSTLALLGVMCGAMARSAGAQQEGAQAVDLFDAMQRGAIAVQVVPHSYFVLSLAIQNRSPQPLRVKTPEVFAAVATKRLAALQAASRAHGRTTLDIGGNYDPGGSQSLGGSFYYRDPIAGQQPASQQQAGDKEVVPLTLALRPGQTVTLKIPCFCMEFGKPDPNPRIPYTLVPLEVVTKSPAIKKVLVEYGKGKYHQAIAQLAMWRVANGAPWSKLANVQWPGRLGRVTPAQLKAAQLLADDVSESHR